MEVPVSSKAMAEPGLMVYRFEAPLYYANAEFFMNELLRLVEASDSAVRWLMVRFDSISDIDYSASKMLLDLIQRLRSRRVALVFTDVDARTKALLQNYGLLAALGEGGVFGHFTEAVTDFRHASSVF